ncbi:MAG: response regulator transcription factor [Acutalibacter sp.]|jgi:two-component system alkaline phosphatase synthesis response regulator PhoP|nr:response regulator transcription factor [Acutalibacter sp.]
MARIFILEDEEAIGNMIAMNLRVAGHEPVLFADGLAAERSLPGDHFYDLAILDVMVPGRDGFQLLEALRPYGIPALFLTARDDISSKLKGLTGGAEDYMVKPFEVLELLVRVDKILARASRGEPILRVLDLEISQEEHRVRKAGKEVPLKPMEFALLVALAKNKNIAVSREDLIGLVWGSGYLGETRTVDVHIGQLRKKLGLHEAIKTIPKLGYRLEEP